MMHPAVGATITRDEANRESVRAIAMTCGFTAGRTAEEAAEPGLTQHRPFAPFWLVLDGEGPALPLTVDLPDGGKALALFSGEDVLRAAGHQGKGAVRQGDLCREGRLPAVLPLVGSETRDPGPPPEMMRSRLLGLLTLERFLRSSVSDRVVR